MPSVAFLPTKTFSSVLCFDRCFARSWCFHCLITHSHHNPLEKSKQTETFWLGKKSKGGKQVSSPFMAGRRTFANNAEKTNLVFLKGASSISNMMLRGTLANYMARYCILWQLMASYVNLWQLFTTYGFLWQLMAIFVICHQAFLPFSILYLRSALLPASLNSIFYIWPSL